MQTDTGPLGLKRRPIDHSTGRADKSGLDAAIVRRAWLIAHLMQNGHVNFDETHRRFGVSVRTYWRDISTLEHAGVLLHRFAMEANKRTISDTYGRGYVRFVWFDRDAVA